MNKEPSTNPIINQLELEVLSSFIAYPLQIDEFLKDVPIIAFSRHGQEVLKKIIELNERESLSKASFLESLSQRQKDSEYYIELLATIPNANVKFLTKSFIDSYLVKRQRDSALQLLNASDNNVILDIDSLLPPLTSTSYKNLEQWQEYYLNKEPLLKYKTGISFLDSVFDGGIECAQLVLISGDPEAGKTTLGLQILEYIAKSHKVCFFSFEFPIFTYLNRKAKDKTLNRQNLIVIDDGFEIYQVANHIKNLYKQGIRVFLIDSQMRLASPNGRNQEEEESLKFSTLARLCHSLKIIVILIVQTSKGDRDNPMGSKKGGHESSITIRIEHDKSDNENLREFSENSRIVILKKNKQTGRHYKERVSFNNEVGKFYALERESETLEVVEI